MKKSEILLHFVAVAVLFLLACPVFAQVTYEKRWDGTASPGLASTLQPNKTYNGRFGEATIGGYTMSTPDQNSRFQSSGVYDSGGGIVGIDTDAEGRIFSSTNNETFKSKMNYRSSYDQRRLLQYQKQAQNNSRSVASADTSLKPVTAQPLPPIPYSTSRTIRYGHSRTATSPTEQSQQILAASSPSEIPSGTPGQQENVALPSSAVPPKEILMRDSIRAARSGQNFQVPDKRTEENAYSTVPINSYNDVPYNYQETPDNYSVGTSRTGLAPDMNQQAVQPLAMPFNQQSPKEAFEESLMLLLMRSPDVNPLSPIQLDYQEDGTVTVRCVVPNESCRIKAGQILLSDPRVRKVNNQISIVQPVR
ncbi:MAG: hypothetical protein IKW74_05790 [Thermoguttaceae bacterium]|nr:hypothetical protein [Thermoguttaceae bacterium]